MNKFKKIGFFKAAGLMLAVMILATFIIFGTLAKYKNTGTVGSLTVSVAKWDVTVGGSPLGDINLGDLSWTIKKDDDYSLEITEGVIAPGTWGYLEIPIVNNSDVDALLTIEVTEEFSLGIDGIDLVCVTLESEPDSFEDAQDSAGNVELTDELFAREAYITIYVCYQWPFDGDDSSDTTAAETYGGEELGLTGELTITATQAKTAA